MGIMAFLDKWMLTNVNACHIELFHIQKELTCIGLQGIIETTKAKKEKKGHCFLCFMTESRTKVT